MALPKLEDITFPDIAFDPECTFVKSVMCSRTAALQVENIRNICKSMKPIISLMKDKEVYYENAIKGILKEEIPHSLHGSGHSHTGSTFQDPVSAGQRFLHTTRGKTPVCKKKALSALVPAIAGLATWQLKVLIPFFKEKEIRPWHQV